MLNFLLTTAAIRDWKVKSGEVKEIRDQETPDKGNVKIEKVLEMLGCEKFESEDFLFTYKTEDKTEGIILAHNNNIYNNIFYAGTEKFKEEVMKNMEKKFLTCWTEEEMITHTGLTIETRKKGISFFQTLDQIEYVKEKMTFADFKAGDPKRSLDNNEVKLLQKLTAQLNWMATQSRPDISYIVMEL